MTDTPPDWVLIEAAKRSDWCATTPDEIDRVWESNPAFRALCDMIQKYEQPPVDRKLLCAREANAEIAEMANERGYAAYCRSGDADKRIGIKTAIRAIELWEEGFGRD